MHNVLMILARMTDLMSMSLHLLDQNGGSRPIAQA